MNSAWLVWRGLVRLGYERQAATLGDAVTDTEQLLVQRVPWASLLGVLAYFGLDVVVLWTAFLALHAHPSPAFAVVVMAYIIDRRRAAPPSHRPARTDCWRRDRLRDPSTSLWADHSSQFD